jgi:hypothetical protein
MAVEPAGNEATTEDFEAHVRDYSGFIKLFKYGAIISLIIALIVMLLIS